MNSAKTTGLDLGRLALIVFGFSLPSFVILGLCWSNDHDTPMWLNYYFSGFIVFGWHAVTTLVLVIAGMVIASKISKRSNRVRNVSIVGIALFLLNTMAGLISFFLLVGYAMIT